TRAVARGRQAVEDQCERLGIDADVVHGPHGGTYRLIRRVVSETPITIAMPTWAEGGSTPPHRLAAAATMAALATTHPTARFVVVYPESLPAELVGLLHDAAGDRWEPLAVPGDWTIAT